MSPLFVPQAAGAAAEPLTWPSVVPWAVGLYYGSVSTFGGGTGTASLPANQLDANPLWVPTACTISELALPITTFGALAVVRLGVYAMGANGLPGALLLDAGTIDAASNGVKLVTGLSLPLAARTWYFLACVGSVTVTTGSFTTVPVPGVYGTPDISSLFGVQPRRSFTYAALPTPFGAPTQYLSAFRQLAVRVGSAP